MSEASIVPTEWNASSVGYRCTLANTLPSRSTLLKTAPRAVALGRQRAHVHEPVGHDALPPWLHEKPGCDLERRSQSSGTAYGGCDARGRSWVGDVPRCPWTGQPAFKSEHGNKSGEINNGQLLAGCRPLRHHQLAHLGQLRARARIILSAHIVHATQSQYTLSCGVGLRSARGLTLRRLGGLRGRPASLRRYVSTCGSCGSGTGAPHMRGLRSPSASTSGVFNSARAASASRCASSCMRRTSLLRSASASGASARDHVHA